MKSETRLLIFLVVAAAAFISQAEGGVICFTNVEGCNVGCASKPGFRSGICRPGYLGYLYCSCSSEVDGSLTPICTGEGGYEACQLGCQVAGDYDAICQTAINFCDCVPRSNGTAN